MSFLFMMALSAQETTEEKKILLIDTGASCITSECHNSMGIKKYMHTIGIDPKKCTRCHVIMQEGEHRFVPIPEKTVNICAQCHDRNTKTPSDVLKKPPKVIFSDEKMQWHKPFAEGKCTVCHDAHESDIFKHLKAGYPESAYATYTPETYTLCTNTQCHQDFTRILETPRVLTGTGFRNGNLNLHYKHVNKRKGRTCRTCHRHHGSNYPDLITQAFTFGSRELSLEFEKTDSGGTCITPCHRKGIYDRYEPVFNAITSSPTPGKDATAEELEASKKLNVQGVGPVD